MLCLLIPYVIHSPVSLPLLVTHRHRLLLLLATSMTSKQNNSISNCMPCKVSDQDSRAAAAPSSELVLQGLQGLQGKAFSQSVRLLACS